MSQMFKAFDVYKYFIYSLVNHLRTNSKTVTYIYQGTYCSTMGIRLLHCNKSDAHTGLMMLNDPIVDSWVICQADGTVNSGHWTCITDIGKVCSRVAAVLSIWNLHPDQN